MLSMNLFGCDLSNPTKIHVSKEAMEQSQLDVILTNKVNTKWTSINISKIEQEMSKIDRAPTIITANSNKWETAPKDYLPGRMPNITLSRCCPTLNKNKITKGRLGNWIAFSLQNDHKRLEIIILYQIPSASSN